MTTRDTRRKTLAEVSASKLFRVFVAGLLAGLLALAVSVSLAQPHAQAQTTPQAADRIVGPGESIQAAVRAAQAGDTIIVRGVHRENVVIRKNGIKLLGNRATLLPPTNSSSPCFGPAGICIIGDVNPNTGQVSRRVSDVSVTGFRVRNFEAFGIIAIGARNPSFVRNHTSGNGEYGIAAFSSTGSRIASNTTRGNGFAGIYVGDSPNANAKITGNDTSRNTLGMFFRNAREGSISGNKTHNNCAGMLFLADAPGPAGQFDVTGNQVRDNTRACPGQDAPPLSGIGVLLLGAHGMEVTGNQISGNIPSGPTAFRGGVVVVRGIGGTPPRNNTVTGNDFGRNRPDIFWDRSGSGNRFTANNCDTSVPARLCG